MLKNERQQYILQKVKEEGRAITTELTAALGVSEDTIRKDFQALSKAGKVIRTHGGVLKLDNENVDLNIRITQQPLVKKALAAKAVHLVMDKHILFIDAGSTNLSFAEQLPHDYYGTVITNDPSITLQLCSHPNINLVMLGGSVDKTSRCITGINTINQLESLNVECCLLGVGALSPENGITYPTQEEAILKQTIVRQSKCVITLATKNKLGKVTTFFGCNISDMDYLVTDETDERILHEYAQSGIHVISVPMQAAEVSPSPLRNAAV